MLTQIDTQTLNGLNLYASFCVAFAAFLRPGELTWDTWDPTTSPSIQVSCKSVKFTSDGVIIHIPKSKTDQIGEGTNVPLSFANDASCPVQALRRLFKKYPKKDSDPLFTRVIGPFNKKWFAENITTTIQKAGIPNASKYSGHSFRRGAANTSIAAGASMEELKTMGRWKSNAAQVYLTSKSTDKLKFAINKRLHDKPPKYSSTWPPLDRIPSYLRVSARPSPPRGSSLPLSSSLLAFQRGRQIHFEPGKARKRP